jgi:hypothetical protein
VIDVDPWDPFFPLPASFFLKKEINQEIPEMPGTLDEVNCCVSPTPTGSSGLSSPPPPASSLSPQHLQSHQDSLNNSQSSREFKDYNGIRSWGSRNNNSRSSSALDRHSESSESLDNHSTCSANGGRQVHFRSVKSNLK